MVRDDRSKDNDGIYAGVPYEGMYGPDDKYAYDRINGMTPEE